MNRNRDEMIRYLESRQREHTEEPGQGCDRSWWQCLPIADIPLWEKVYPVAPQPLDVERLARAMERACDDLAVTSLCPGDAPVILARLGSQEGSAE